MSLFDVAAATTAVLTVDFISTFKRLDTRQHEMYKLIIISMR